jgi:hypothetical protein
MESLEVLHTIISKLNRYEFSHFTQQVISKMQEFSGLYEVFELYYRLKIGLVSDKVDIPQVELFDNEILRLFYMVLSYHDNIFVDYENMELQIIHFYESAVSLLDGESNVITVELLHFLINKISQLLRYLDAYSGKSICNVALPLSLCPFEEIILFYNKKEFCKCLNLIQETPENSPFLEWLQCMIEFEENTNFESLRKVLHSLDVAHTVSEETREMKLFYKMHVYLQQSNLVHYVNLKSIYKHTDTNTDILRDFLQHDTQLPADFPCQKYLKFSNLMETIILDLPAYEKFIDQLYRDRDILFRAVFQDFMVINNNKKRYFKNAEFYRLHKKVIQFYLKKKNNPIFRYSIFVAVENALFNTNKFYDRLEFQEFIKGLDISPEIHKKYGTAYEYLQKKIRCIEEKFYKT